MRGSKPYIVDRLYIDHAGFVANLDEVKLVLLALFASPEFRRFSLGNLKHFKHHTP